MHKIEWKLGGSIAMMAVFLMMTPTLVHANPAVIQDDTSLAAVMERTVSNTKDENYAVADVNTNLNVRQGAGTDYTIIGKLPKDALCYVSHMEGEWSYITSGEIEGYAYTDYLITGIDGREYTETVGEEAVIFAYAVEEAAETVAEVITEEVITEEVIPEEVTPEEVTPEEVTPEEVTETSAETASLRSQIVDFAQQFIGNPYVWGGTSLTNGADCSGFVQSVYAEFGISLPRVSREQAQVGTKISVEEAEPGDLIFYARDGEIYHVVMYIGDGQVVHASTRNTGIKISQVNEKNAVWAIRLLDQ